MFRTITEYNYSEARAGNRAIYEIEENLKMFERCSECPSCFEPAAPAKQLKGLILQSIQRNFA